MKASVIILASFLASFAVTAPVRAEAMAPPMADLHTGIFALLAAIGVAGAVWSWRAR